MVWADALLVLGVVAVVTAFLLLAGLDVRRRRPSRRRRED